MRWDHRSANTCGCVRSGYADGSASNQRCRLSRPVVEYGGAFGELCSEEAGPAVEIPEDIRSEVAIALGRRADSETTARLADPVALSCPACGGVLSQLKQGSPLRFRCQVGHAYTAEALASEQEGSVDEAVRVALRIMEERIVLTQKMAEEARRSGRDAAAALYEKRLNESRTYADILLKAIAMP